MIARLRELPLDLFVITVFVGYLALCTYCLGDLAATSRDHEKRLRTLEGRPDGE